VGVEQRIMQKKKVSGRKAAGQRSDAIRLAIEIYRRRPSKKKSATSKGGILPRGIYSIRLRVTDKNGRTRRNRKGVLLQTTAEAENQSTRRDRLSVSLQRPASVRTRDQAFWSLIRS
jgi:hypothetical protein